MKLYIMLLNRTFLLSSLHDIILKCYTHVRTTKLLKELSFVFTNIDCLTLQNLYVVNNFLVIFLLFQIILKKQLVSSFLQHVLIYFYGYKSIYTMGPRAQFYLNQKIHLNINPLFTYIPAYFGYSHV